MPIRIRPARFLLLHQACSRPSTTARSFPSASVPPRRQTPSQLVSLRTMSSSARPATTHASPASAASTSPLPGNTPSASPATPGQPGQGSGSGSGGAAPAPAPAAGSPQSPSRSHSASVAAAEPQPALTDGTPASDGAIPAATSTSTSSTTSNPTDNSMNQPKLPALPAPDSIPATDGSSQGIQTVHVNGQPIALDNLGPMVVGRDGTISRIANWHEMTDIERQNTLRVLGKRNQLRLGNLRAGLPADQKPGSSSE